MITGCNSSHRLHHCCHLASNVELINSVQALADPMLVGGILSLS